MELRDISMGVVREKTMEPLFNVGAVFSRLMRLLWDTKERRSPRRG